MATGRPGGRVRRTRLFLLLVRFRGGRAGDAPVRSPRAGLGAAPPEHHRAGSLRRGDLAGIVLAAWSGGAAARRPAGPSRRPMAPIAAHRDADRLLAARHPAEARLPY